MVATRCCDRLTASSIPGVRSRRPLALSVAAALVVTGICATASQRGYGLGDLALDRASVSSTWDSMSMGAVDLWNDLTRRRRTPPLPPSIPAARPVPVAELPPEAFAAPIQRVDQRQVPKAARAAQIRVQSQLTSLPRPQKTASVHSGVIAYE
jgi:hypothetical protein